MSSEAWFSLLELAEEYGWNPLGTFTPGWWIEPGDILSSFMDSTPEPSRAALPSWDGSYTTSVDEARLVMLEDALNLADALEAALLEYEPEPLSRLTPRSLSQLRELGFGSHSNPSIGTIATLKDFCCLGAFTLERG